MYRLKFYLCICRSSNNGHDSHSKNGVHDKRDLITHQVNFETACGSLKIGSHMQTFVYTPSPSPSLFVIEQTTDDKMSKDHSQISCTVPIERDIGQEQTASSEQMFHCK